MREEGQAVSIAQLCRWFGVTRSTFYYRPPVRSAPRPPVVDTTVEAQIRTIIEAEPVAGLRMITARVRRASIAPVNHKKTRRALGRRHDPSLLRARWVVPPDRDH
jgi:hypothetical protein